MTWLARIISRRVRALEAEVALLRREAAEAHAIAAACLRDAAEYRERAHVLEEYRRSAGICWPGRDGVEA